MRLYRHTALAALALAALPALGAPRAAGAQDGQAAAQPQRRSHTVRRGDTLWDLSRSYLGDPFSWPQIYRLNTSVVEDPHWIYPGERLALPDVVTVVPEPEVPAPAVFSPASNVAPRATAPDRLAPLGRGSYAAVRAGEVYAAPFVEREGGPARAGRIVQNVELSNVRSNPDSDALLLNDEVYLAPPAGSTLNVGDELLVYTLGARFEKVGQLVVPTGVLRVERARAGEAPRARLTRQFGRVLVGQQIMPFQAELPPADATPGAIENGAQAAVLWIPGEPVLPSIQQYVVLDASTRAGTRVGDQFTLVRPRQTRAGSLPLPEEEIAVAQVVRVTAYAATALIVSQDHPAIRRGARARLTAKMP